MSAPSKDPPLNSRVKITVAADHVLGREGRLIGIQDHPAPGDIWWTDRYWVLLDNGASASARGVAAVEP